MMGAFLWMALALPHPGTIVAYHPDYHVWTKADQQFVMLLKNIADPDHREDWALIVGEVDPMMVDFSRTLKVASLAFWPNPGKYAVMGYLRENPFKNESFVFVWLREPVTEGTELYELLKLPMYGAIVALDPGEHLSLPRWLKRWGWDRLPFDWHHYQLWRRTSG